MNSLEQLKEILLGEEKAQLLNLERKQSSQKLLAERTSEILPQAIERVSSNPDFVASLEGAVSKCVHKSVKKDSKLYADALFPIIGPAIRLSILETFRSFVSSINQAVENSFSIKGLKWRWQAWRAGVPFADYVLSQTITYRVEQIFLIQPETGLLMAHTSHPAVLQKTDVDAFSAMLTAIQQFVVDSFSVDGQTHLDSVDLGELTVMLFASPAAVMAVAVRGVAPRKIKTQFQELLEHLSHKRYEALSQFDGDRGSMAIIESTLEPFLVEEKREEKTSTSTGKHLQLKLLTITLVFLLCQFTWNGVSHIVDHNRASNVVATLEQTPGYSIQSLNYESGRWRLKGLRDPHSISPKDVISRLGMDEELFDFYFESFFSFDDEVLYVRVQKMLTPPSSVSMSVSNRVIHLSGSADLEWIQSMLALRILNLLGLSVDTSKLKESEHSRAKRVASWAGQQNEVSTTITGNKVYISGIAPQAWISQIPEQMSNLGMHYDIEDLRSFEWYAAKLIEDLESTQIHFVNDKPIKPHLTTLIEVADKASHLSRLVHKMGGKVSCRLVGHSDGVGSRAANKKIRVKRAQYIDTVLETAGLPKDFCIAEAAQSFTTNKVADPTQRKVTVEIDNSQIISSVAGDSNRYASNAAW